MTGKHTPSVILRKKDSQGLLYIGLLALTLLGDGKGAGRPVKIMTPGNKNRLRRAVNNTTGVSQNRMAAKFG